MIPAFRDTSLQISETIENVIGVLSLSSSLEEIVRLILKDGLGILYKPINMERWKGRLGSQKKSGNETLDCGLNVGKNFWKFLPNRNTNQLPSEALCIALAAAGAQPIS